MGVGGFCQVSILRFWQNIEKQSFFSVNIPSKRQFIRLKLSKNDFSCHTLLARVRQKTRKVIKFHAPNSPLKLAMDPSSLV